MCKLFPAVNRKTKHSCKQNVITTHDILIGKLSTVLHFLLNEEEHNGEEERGIIPVSRKEKKLTDMSSWDHRKHLTAEAYFGKKRVCLLDIQI